MPNLIPFPIQPKMSNMVPVSNFENGKKHQKKYGQVLVEGEKEKKTNMVPFLKLFKFADSLDYILMAIGTTGAMLHGASFPVFFLIFGKLVNVIGVAAASSSPVSDEVAKVQQRLADVYGKQKTVVDYHKHFVSFEPGDLTMVFRKDDNEREGHQTHDAYALDFLYLSVVVLFSSWMEVSCWMYTGERQSAKMRLSYLRSMLNQDISLFDMKDSTGEIIAAITSDVIVIQDAISEKVGNFIHYVCGSITGFTIGFIKVWQISLVTLSIVPLMVIAGGLHVYVETGLIARVRKSYVKAGTIADEVIGNIRTVQAFVAEEKAVKSYTAALTKSYEYGKKGGLAKGLGLGAIYFFLFTSWALLIWFTSIVVHEGIANGGESFATMAIVVTSGLSLGRAAPNLGVFIKARVAAYSIFDMIESAHNKLKSKNCRSLKKVRGHIEFHNVCFSYPSRSNVTIIDHLNLDIPSGKVVALVGGSGSGKSTVVSLIERFYEPRSGHILLDRNNIRDLDLNWFRQQIGLVNQEPALFSTTIRENILYGKNNATLQEITQAARLSEALSFITNLPDKYDTQVGERGIQLSGGQKQRIAIARAILRNPAILLLDEATSALDAESEKSVQRALDQVMVDRTTVVVAHRLSTIRNADVIAVFNGGRIIETGSHSELLSDPNSAYSGLVEMQQATSSRDHQTVSPNFGPSTSIRYSSTELSNISSSFGSSIYSERDYVSHNVPYGIEIKLPTKTSSVSMRRLFEIAAPDYLYWVLGVLGAIAVGIQMPLFALGIATTLAAYYKDWDSTQSEIRELALIFCVCAALNVVFNTVEHLSFGIMGERLTLRARAMMFSAILRNEIGWFDETDNNSSILSSRLEADATALKILVVDRFAMLVQNISLAVTSFVIAFIFNWRMTFVILATYPLIILGNISEKLFIQGYGGNLSKTYLKANMLAGEAVINIRTLAGFGAEDKMVSLYSHELIDPKKQAFRRGQIAGIFYGITQFFIFSSYGLALWYGSVLLDKGQANFSSIIKPYFVLMVAAILMAETLAMAPDLMKGNQMVSSLFEIMDRKTKVENDIGEVIGSVEGRIQLNGIKFSYPSRPDVLIFNGFDLKVRIGQSVALVGSSGSGKSSVIALILRYYNPTAGRITIDGKDIKKLNLKSLRKHIGLVQQEPTLFATTIYENILYGRDGASESEVIQAAKLANAHTFVSGLPKGYSTKVGERGIQLSGGQKQRVAIARAILKNPSILLLDEATSSLDVISERTVQQALDRIMKNRTTIVVAHRLSTIKKADQICVLQEGKIIEKGSHSSLIENEAGMYYKLIKHQQQ